MAQSIMITSEEDVATVQVTVRQLVRVTRVRRHVQELQDQVLKVVRCLYIEEFLREVSQIETLLRLSVST
jgi:hypothetical protein